MIFARRPASSAGRTTQFLVSRTLRLRAWWVQQDPYTLGGVALLLAIAVGSVAVQAAGPWLASRAPQGIVIFATPQPTIGGLAAVRAGGAVERLEPLRSGVPTTTPAPVPTDAPILAVMAAPPSTEPPPPPPTETPAPLPAVEISQQQLLTAPADPNWRATPTVAQQVIVRNPDGTVFSNYACQPYGDWRDNDPKYAHPECRP